MSSFAKLKDLVAATEADATAFYEKGNKAAGTRVRNSMQAMKGLAQDIRLEVQNMKNAEEAAAAAPAKKAPAAKKAAAAPAKKAPAKKK